ncbi:MAG TPA: C2H2-type zinc finger protein [Candidatus Dormibacteraeota bacterium]
MKCEICDQEFANSVELDKHKEREHPMGEGDESLEKPDMLQDQEQPAPIVPGKN